mmetsp:Transcript_42840/g.56626  ORF Transcript_42840/g.56626 Transcript_42840/m.56626 type:complete len:117 (+) Transcript_42840:543-893(+)
MISEAITHTIRLNLGSQALNLDAFRKLDGVLLKFYEQNLMQKNEVREESKTPMSMGRPGTQDSMKTNSAVDSPGKAFIKACSEAVFFGVAHCVKQESSLAASFRQNLHPNDQMIEN